MSTDDYILAYGTHASPQDGRCAMEWVSHLAGEPHTDEPRCVSPVLRAICIALNDGLEHEPRQRLRPYLARTIGTAGDGLDERRSWLALDWLVRVYGPAWLALGALDGPAAQLRSLPVIDGIASLRAALPSLDDARATARTARRDAFAGRFASGWAPATAAGMAGREAAWACAGAAAWAAVRTRIEVDAADRARGAVRAAAGDAVAAAVRRARPPAARRLGGAARPPARATLAPTAEALVGSVLELLDRMLPTVLIELPQPVEGTGAAGAAGPGAAALTS